MTSEFLNHIPEETLEQYCLGRLAEPEVEPIEEHLLFCDSCQEMLSQTDNFLRAIRVACEELPAEAAVEPWWKRVWVGLPNYTKPALAMATCALAVFLFLPGRNPGSAVVDLQAMRGRETNVEAPAGKNLTLRLSVDGLAVSGPYELRVSNLAGASVATAAVEQSGSGSVAHVESLSAGTYWARLFANGQLVREYSLSVR
jgi:hypothetical protein